MKNSKILLIPSILVLMIFLFTIVSAGSVTTSLFYDSTTASTLTINNGDSIEVIVSADSLFETSMTIKLDILDSSGNVVANILDVYTTEDSYDNYVMIGLSAYTAPGSYTLTSTVTGISGQQDTKSLTLTVLPPTPGNNAPVITSVPALFVDEGLSYSYQVIATDIDGDALIYSLTQNPTWLSISPTGLITGTAPIVNSDYSYSITVQVSDGTDMVTQTFSIIVRNIASPGNNAPVITSIPVTSVNEAQSYSYQVIATDADNDALTYSLTSAPAWLSISPAGLITGTAPIVNSDYSYSITVQVSDGTDMVTQSFSVLVIDTGITDTINPVVTILSPIDGRTYDTRQISVNFTAIDLNLNSCYYSLNGDANITTACNTAFTITTAEGTNTLTIYAIDLAGNIGSQSITFYVDTSDDDGDSNNRAKHISDTDGAKQYLEQFASKTVTEEEEVLTLSKATSFWQISWIWIIIALLILIVLAIIFWITR